MISAAKVVSSDDPYEQLISSIITIESQPKVRVQSDLSEQKRLKGVISDVGSKLSALHTVLKGFNDLFNSPFDARTANLSDASSFTVAAGKKAAYGSHTVQVERLATTDTRISNQHTKSATGLRSFFDTNGAQTFSIGLLPDAESPVSIDVTFDPTGATDGEILQELSDAINAAMDAAVENGTITSKQRASGSVVNETSGTARLSLRSAGTGYENRLSFTDSADGFLSQIGLYDGGDPGRLASGTSGGQVTNVGTSETDSALNAKFMLDGLTLYRSSNQVNDALTDVTLNLKATGTEPRDFSVTPNETAIKDEITNFIKKYNDVLSYIEGKARVDGTTEVRGDFANDSTFTSLRFGMRNDLVRTVSGQPADGVKAITDLGIKINNDGTLELEDEDKLFTAVQQNAGAVQSFFSGNDGLARRLETRLDQYVGSKGIIDQRKTSFDDRIKRLDDRVKAWDERLSSREAQLRNEFAYMQKMIQSFQGQQASLNSFFLY